MTYDVPISDRHRLGGNNPPLDEILEEETTALRQRATALVEAAGRAKITDDETAGKVTALAVMITRHIALVDGAREAAKKPFLESGRIVDAHFGLIIKSIRTAKATLRTASDAWLKLKADEAKAEQCARQAEARKREIEANQLRAIAEMSDDTDGVLKAEAAQAQAKVLAMEAAEPVKIWIDSGLGAKAHATTVKVVVIDDLHAVLMHIATNFEPEAREFAQKVCDRLARAKVSALPGTTIKEELSSRFR